MIKSTVFVFLLVFSFAALADHHGGGKNFADVKAQAEANIDQRIANLQEAKTCISGAADKAALKACRQTLKSKQKSIKSARMGKKMDRMNKRMDKMKAKKEKMDAE